MSNFITEIKIGKVRHLENIDIKLGNEKKHLILTGKNGSGKTSVLEELDRFFESLFEGGYIVPKEMKEEEFQEIFMNQYSEKLKINFNNDAIFKYVYKSSSSPYIYSNTVFNYVYSSFKARRVIEKNQVDGIKKINFDMTTKIDKLNQNFLQYIVNLKAESSFAREDNDFDVAKKIDEWFKDFELILQRIFNDTSLYLTFDRKNYNFNIHRSNREVFDFNGLSDGYSSILDIVTELILKIENTKSKSFDCEGIVLIDEIETHLHVELQKNILPLLTSFFPNIQFIVTTHSPFVLQSIENSIVFDLERKEQLNGEKLSKASYTDIVKNYFEVDSQFSQVLENEIMKYENLVQIFDENSLTIEEEKELLELDIKLDKIAPMLSDTIYLRFKEAQDRISEHG